MGALPTGSGAAGAVWGAAGGHRPGVGFRALDWQVAEAEDAEAYLALLQRLYERGLEEVPLIVADGCGSVRAAAQIVYPTVTKLRASDGTTLGTFAVGTDPFGVAFDGASIWVANSGSNTVSKL